MKTRRECVCACARMCTQVSISILYLVSFGLLAQAVDGSNKVLLPPQQVVQLPAFVTLRTYTHTTHTHAHAHTHTVVWMQACIHAKIRRAKNQYATCKQTYTCVCFCGPVCVCVSICAYACVCPYMHTLVHAPARSSVRTLTDTGKDRRHYISSSSTHINTHTHTHTHDHRRIARIRSLKFGQQLCLKIRVQLHVPPSRTSFYIQIPATSLPAPHIRYSSTFKYLPRPPPHTHRYRLVPRGFPFSFKSTVYR